jgi:hypothetical protein
MTESFMGLRTCDPFDIPVPTDLPAVLARVRSLIVAEGGQFSGDAAAGRFSGTSPVGPVEGRYTIQGASIRITITSKPMLLPCSVIEERIRGYFK